jgi:hypothetical protein
VSSLKHIRKEFITQLIIHQFRALSNLNDIGTVPGVIPVAFLFMIFL